MGDMLTTLDERIDLNGIADSCRLLSACFCLPDKALFQGEKLLENLTVLCEKNFPMVSPLIPMMTAAFKVCSDEELKIEYSRLFIGPDRLIAPPYGSVYLEQDYQVMGASTIEVQKIYELAGLSLSEDVKQPPDHISLELEFMYYLLFKLSEQAELFPAAEESVARTRLNQFLGVYLAPWVAPFVVKIREGTTNEFYCSLADVLGEFIVCCKVWFLLDQD